MPITIGHLWSGRWGVNGGIGDILRFTPRPSGPNGIGFGVASASPQSEVAHAHKVQQWIEAGKTDLIQSTGNGIEEGIEGELRCCTEKA